MTVLAKQERKSEIEELVMESFKQTEEDNVLSDNEAKELYKGLLYSV